MGASWSNNGLESTSSSASSSMASLEPSDPPHVKPLVVSDVRENSFAAPEEMQSSNSKPSRKRSEIERSSSTDWRGMWRSHAKSVVHPTKTSNRNILARSRTGSRKEVRKAEMGTAANHCISLPMKCPPSRSSRTSTDPIEMSIAHSSGTSEYLQRVCDLRTWNMYNLITQSRRKQQARLTTYDSNTNANGDRLNKSMLPDAIQETEIEEDATDPCGSYDECGHVMVFPLDDH